MATTELVMRKKNILLEKASNQGFSPIEIEGKTILILNEFESAMSYALKNSVIYLTGDINKKQQFDMLSQNGCGDDDTSILVEETTDWIKALEGMKDMKFSAVIMNPPYKGDLHLNILKYIIDNKMSDIIIDLAPIVKIVSKRLKFTDKVKSFEKFIPMFKYIQEVNKISYEEFESLFGAKPQNEIGITVYNLNKIDENWTKDKYCDYATEFYSKMSEEEFLDFRFKAGL